MASPVCSADQCQTSCNHSTAASSPAPNVAENSTAVTLAQANARTRNSASSTTGRGCTADLRPNQVRATAATANDVSTPAEDQPHSGPLTMPRATAPMPIATRRAPRRSGPRVIVRAGQARPPGAREVQGVGDGATRDDEPEQTDGHVDEEDPAPGRLHEQPADDRPGRCGERADGGPAAHGAHSSFRRSGGEQQSERRRGERRGADRVDAAESDQSPQVLAESA